MIFVTDSAGQTIHASSEYENLTGRSVESALGRGWLNCVHPEDRPIVERTLEEALSTVSEFSIRYRLIRPSGSYRWVGVGGIPSIGPPGCTFIGYLGSLTEIADEAIDGIQAYGNVERFIPPPPHPNTTPSCKLDLVADHLLLAHSLIEEDGGKNVMPALREALFEVGRALAARTLRPSRPLN